MADQENGKGAAFNLTVPVTMTFPNLFTPRAFGAKGKETGDPKYSANFSFEPESTDLKAMKASCAAVAKAKWPGRAFVNAEDPSQSLVFPFTSGDRLADKAKREKKDREFYRGKIILASRSKYQPRLSGIENGNAVDYEADMLKTVTAKFYPGVLVLAQFNFVAYPGVGRNPDGVTAYLNMVFTTGKGPRLNTGQSAAEVFKGYVGHVSAEDPTGGQFAAPADEDEIPV